MALVVFSGRLEELTGQKTFVASSLRYRELLDELVSEFSALDTKVLTEMAVAIDGEIIHTPYLETFTESSEIHFIHKISGG